MNFCLVVVCAIGIVQAVPAKQNKVDVQLLSRLLDTLKTMGKEREEQVVDTSSAAADFQAGKAEILKYAKETCSQEVVDAIENTTATTVNREEIISSMEHLLGSIYEWHENHPELNLENLMEMHTYYNCEYMVVHSILARLHFFGEEGVGRCEQDLGYEFMSDFACCSAIWTYMESFQTEFIGQISYVVLSETDALDARGLRRFSGSTREVGQTGATGAQGNPGRTGATGEAGATGARGSRRFSGSTREEGQTGATGAQGNPGRTGATGEAGATGARGSRRFSGSTREEGQTGATGAQGNPGRTGATGEAGATGAMGSRRFSGSTREEGQTGATGAQGNPGRTGATGAAGATGAPGNSGLTLATEERGFLHNLTLQELCDGFDHVDWVAHTLSDIMEFASEGWCGFEFGNEYDYFYGDYGDDDNDDGEKRSNYKKVKHVTIAHELISKFVPSALIAKRHEMDPMMKKHMKYKPWRK